MLGESPHQHLNSALPRQPPTPHPPEQQPTLVMHHKLPATETRDLQELDISEPIVVETPQHPSTDELLA
jgi:hypothetical protein